MHKSVTHPTDTNTSPPPDAQPEAPYSLCKKYMTPANVGSAVLDGWAVGAVVTTAVGRGVGFTVTMEVGAIVGASVLAKKAYL
jgi:hypothetical protein